MQHGIVLGLADDFGFEQELEVLMSRFNICVRHSDYTATYVLDVAQRPVDHRILEGAHGGVMCEVTAVCLAMESIQTPKRTYTGYQRFGTVTLRVRVLCCCLRLRRS